MNTKAANLSGRGIKPSTLGNSYVVIAALLWGTTGTAAQLAPGLSPITIAAVAMGGGGLLQALLAGSHIIKALPRLKQQWRLWLLGALAVAVYPLAFYSAMHMAGVAVGTVVAIGSAPLLSALIENRLEQSPLAPKWWLGAVIAVLGIILLVYRPAATERVASAHTLIGIGLGIVAGLTYSCYSWTARTMMVTGMSSRAAMGGTFGLGGLLLVPVLIASGTSLFDSGRNAAVASYMALLPMCIGYLCYGAGLARIRASTATAITLLEPVVAAWLAVLVLNERLPFSAWLGMVMIIASLTIIVWPSAQAKHRGSE